MDVGEFWTFRRPGQPDFTDAELDAQWGAGTWRRGHRYGRDGVQVLGVKMVLSSPEVEEFLEAAADEYDRLRQRPADGEG